MVAEALHRGRPSAVELTDRLALARRRNALLAEELRALRSERASDVSVIRPLARRLLAVAEWVGPEAMQAAMAILDRVERMARRAA